MSCWENTGRDEGSVPIMGTTLSVRQRKRRSPALVAGPSGRDRRRPLWVDPVGGPGSLTGLPSVAAWHLPVDSGHLPHRGHLFGFLLLGLEASRRHPLPHSWLGNTQQPPVEHHPGLYLVGHHRRVPGYASGRCGPDSRFARGWLGHGGLVRARYPLWSFLGDQPP